MEFINLKTSLPICTKGKVTSSSDISWTFSPFSSDILVTLLITIANGIYSFWVHEWTPERLTVTNGTVVESLLPKSIAFWLRA